MKTPKDLVAEAAAQVPHMSCDDYLASMKNTDHVLLDVREKEEHDAGHIEGAVNIPRGVLEFKIEEQVPDKSTKLVICCATGGRAALSAINLLALGYEDVSVLEGGYKGYCEATE